MTSSRYARLLVGGALLAGLAACTTTPTPSPTPTATTTTPVAANCPAGSWTSTSVASSASAAGVTLTISGGSGVKLTVGADGTVNADFTGMQPATFTTQVGGVNVGGQISYSGPVTGNVAAPGSTPTTGTSGLGTATPLSTGAGTPAPTGSAGSGPSGAWSPTGTPNTSGLTITIKLTAPTAATVLDNVKVSDVTSGQLGQVGGVADLQPLLRAGTYQCDGSNTGLTITTSADNALPIVWTFARG